MATTIGIVQVREGAAARVKVFDAVSRPGERVELSVSATRVPFVSRFYV